MVLLSLAVADDDMCSMIQVGSIEDSNDIIGNGILTKSFDSRITLKEDLNYIPYEKQSHIIYIVSPVALLEAP